MTLDADVLIRLRQIIEDPGPPRHALVATLFDRELPVAGRQMDAAFSAADMRCLVDLDLVRRSESSYMPLSRIDRVDRLLIASDLRRRRRQADYVVGPGPASFLLARYIRLRGDDRALDFGCGSGILSLLLASARPSVLAVDINPRAVAYTRFNAALNGYRGITAEGGNFLSDVADERFDGRFDVVVSNPPYVLAPVHRLVYRDRPLPGDQVSARTIERVGRALAPGGRGYVLTNWIGRGEPDWSTPVRRWIEPMGLDAFVTQVGDHSPAAYAAAWNRDIPDPRRARAVAQWQKALDAEGVRSVQAGVIALSRAVGGTYRRPRVEAVDRNDGTVSWRSIDAFFAETGDQALDSQGAPG